MAYLAGMIWSVSMLSPNFHARPRTTLGRVMAAPTRDSPDYRSSKRRGHLREDFGRVGDHAGHRAGRGDRGVGEVDLRLRMAHAAWEVAVGRAQADLALAEHAHVPAQTRAARGGRPRGAGGEERADQPLLLGLDR